MSGPADPVQAAQLREAGIDGFTARSREVLAEYAEWLAWLRGHAGCPGCPACGRVWAYYAGSLAACTEGLLGVIDAACLPVGGRHEPREDAS